jgi:ADP-heptose:LPS heptosyltransferase
LGDAILLTPLINNLKRAIPHAQIHIITNSPIVSFYKNDPNIDEVHKGKNHYISLFKLIKSHKFDILFCTKDHPSFTFLYQSRLIRARFRVGIEHPYHHGFFNYLIKLDFHKHVIEKNCALLDYMGITYTKENCRPYLPEGNPSAKIKQFADKILNKKYIGINLSAGDKQREWSLDKWIQLVSHIEQRIIVFAMPDRYEDKEEIENKFDHVLSSPPTESIDEVAALLKNLTLLISPDTSLIHLASCVNVNVVGLYNSDIIQAERFYPYLIEYKKCISPTRDIEDIPVDEVGTAVHDILSHRDTEHTEIK